MWHGVDLVRKRHARTAGLSHPTLLQQATLDAFETLSLGPSGPSMPGQPPDGGPNPAAFPRPAGSAAQVEGQVGPPEPYSPFNCKPEFVRMTSFAVPNSQVGAGAGTAGHPGVQPGVGGTEAGAAGSP